MRRCLLIGFCILSVNADAQDLDRPLRGRVRFDQLGCRGCHDPSWLGGPQADFQAISDERAAIGEDRERARSEIESRRAVVKERGRPREEIAEAYRAMEGFRVELARLDLRQEALDWRARDLEYQRARFLEDRNR